MKVLRERERERRKMVSKGEWGFEGKFGMEEGEEEKMSFKEKGKGS